MKTVSIFLFLSSFILFSFAQKKAIDITMLDQWPKVGNAAITNNGKYFSYTIHNQPLGSHTLVFQDLKIHWKAEFINAKDAVFTEDSRKAIFLNAENTMCILTLGSDDKTDVPNVTNFRLLNYKGTQWLSYQQNSAEKKISLYNLHDKTQESYNDVIEYLVSHDGNTMVLKTDSSANGKNIQSLYWINLQTKEKKLIWRGSSASNIIFDESTPQLAFLSDIIETKSRSVEKILNYYNPSLDSSLVLDIKQKLTRNNELNLDKTSSFSRDGNKLYIVLKDPDYPKPNPQAVKLDVWHYSDYKLQSQQLSDLTTKTFFTLDPSGPESFSAVVNLRTQNIVRLQNKNEQITLFSDRKKDDIAVITFRKGNNKNEWNWNNDSRPVFSIISTLNGNKTPLSINYPYALSPNGKYLIGTDSYIEGMCNNFLCYNLETGKVCNITQSLPVPTNETELFAANSLKHRGLSIVGWLSADKALWVYDQYDIWQLDPTGVRPPLNLTNGYGRRMNIRFRISRTNDYTIKAIPEKTPILLSAFNLLDKRSGFYLLNVEKKRDPQLLSMGNYYYDEYFDYTVPLKARDASIFIVKRESATESPNYYYTSDFKTFSHLTSISPERRYNWLTSELLSFETPDGKMNQGILYKPENFDSSLTYPVIIHYYQTLSSRLNHYLPPSKLMSEINIPWFVSNGYLVFTPDIHYIDGEPGESALKSVTSARDYLTKYPWVNPKKIGIQGHSFGGYETNYIITHSDKFAAAMSSSGFSNLISAYGSTMLSSGAPYFRGWAETGQGRLINTLWERPDLYIKNSPIFFVDKVTTPILLMNNKEDDVVPFSQGVEFFSALRRLGKKAWLLQYDGESHAITSASAQTDYTIRMTQFFNHYLKDSLPPLWMTQGIAAKLKGIDDGLRIDSTRKSP